MKPTVAVIGLGVVGQAVYDALKGAGYKTLGYSRSKPHNSYKEIAEKAQIIFLVVGTPSQEDGKVNMDAIYDVMENLEDEFVDSKNPRPIIVVKSTVVPGTNSTLQKLYPGYIFVSSPEFLTEKNALEDFKYPDRTIIGCDNDEVFETLCKVYESITNDEYAGPIMHVTPIEAELAKYASNYFLALRVTFANEMNKICQMYGVRWNGDISTAVGLDHRIGDSHFEVTEKGGYGGMCLPKDTKGLYNESLLRGYKPLLLTAVIEANDMFRSKEGTDPYTDLDN